MANSYRKIYLQIVFAVKNRQSLLHKNWRGRLFEYTAGIVNNRGHYALAINGSYDHIHIFFDYKGHELIKDLVREIKKALSQFIKDQKLCPFKFEWQSGYGVFSHGYREKEKIIEYVRSQETHHRNKTFREEYLAFLKAYEIEFKEEYVFDFLE